MDPCSLTSHHYFSFCSFSTRISYEMLHFSLNSTCISGTNGGNKYTEVQTHTPKHIMWIFNRFTLKSRVFHLAVCQ